jgi:putative chitinase
MEVEMMWTSKYFTLDEMTASNTAIRKGINNVPTGAAMQALAYTATRMDTVRTLLGHPIRVSSGYRSPALNKVIGGSNNSAHTLGYAVDFTCPGYGSPKDVCKAIMAAKIQYDQLIWEFGTWVHISFDPRNRMQDLTAVLKNKDVIYLQGIK